MQLLDSLLRKEMSFREVEKKSMGIKSMQVAKDILLQKVECETWEKAAEVLPHYCNEQALSQFKVVKGKALPDVSEVYYMSGICSIDAVVAQVFCDKAVAIKKSKCPENEPETLRNGVFVADENTLRMVPFMDSSVVMLDMSTVSWIMS